MRKVLALILSASVLWSVSSMGQSTVNATYHFADFTTAPQAVKRITLTPLQPFADYTNTILSAVPIARVTDTNGSYTYTNVISGYSYRVELSTPYGTITRTNGFPSGLTGNVNAQTYNGVWVGPQVFAYFYPQGALSFFVQTNNAGSVVLTNAANVLGGTATGLISTNQTNSGPSYFNNGFKVTDIVTGDGVTATGQSGSKDLLFTYPGSSGASLDIGSNTVTSPAFIGGGSAITGISTNNITGLVTTITNLQPASGPLTNLTSGQSNAYKGSFTGDASSVTNLKSEAITNLTSTFFAGPVLGALLNGSTSIVTVVFGLDSEAEDGGGAYLGIPMEMIRQWELRLGWAGNLKQGESWWNHHNPSVWCAGRNQNLGSRPEGTNWVDQVAVLYSDGLDAWYEQDDRLGPGPVGSQSLASISDAVHPWRNSDSPYKPVNEWGIRLLGNTNCGVVKIIHTNEYGSETFFVNCQTAMVPSVTNACIYTNFNMGAFSVYNHWQVSSVNGTNIVFAIEALDTLHGGVAPFHWANPSMGYGDWLFSDTNHPGALYNLMLSASPSAGILISKHGPGPNGTSAITNQFQAICKYMHGGFTPTGMFTNNCTTNNFMAVVGTFPTSTNTDPGYAYASADLAFVKASVAGLPGGGTNFFVLDLLSKFTNGVYLFPAMLDTQQLHPSKNGNPWATEANRQLGMDVLGFRAGYGLSTNVPIGPATALTIANGKVTGIGPFYSVASTPIYWIDAAHLVYSGTNVSSATGVNGALGMVSGGAAQIGVVTNDLNGFNTLIFPDLSGFHAGGNTRDNFVDTVNHADTTLVFVVKPFDNRHDILLSASDGAGNNLQARLSFSDGIVAFLCGTNTLTATNDATVGFAVWRFQRTGTNMSIFKNGALLNSIAASGITLGAGFNTMDWAQDFGYMKWAEHMVYNRGLSVAEAYSTDHSLCWKYNIAAADGVGPFTISEAGVSGLIGDLNSKASSTNPTFIGVTTLSTNIAFANAATNTPANTNVAKYWITITNAGVRGFFPVFQ